MRVRVHGLVVGLVAGGLALTGSPAPALAADHIAPIALVIGLRAPSDVVSSLERRDVDVVGSEAKAGVVTVDVPADQATDAADALRADPAVSYVEPDHIAHMSAATLIDPGYAGQWGLTTGRVRGAWATTTGSAAVTVAVVDTGVRAMPDLAGRLLPGRDFVNDDDDATDDNGHGTMAAGVIAAAGNNGIGIAGICWACRILPVKVLDSHGTGSYSDIAAGIRYAADAHADIINLSLGGSADAQVLRDAVAYAADQGSLVVAAAGNDASAVPHYPAAIPAALAVGGSTAADGRYPWSNWGSSWVDIAAPGCNSAQALDGVVGQFCGTSSATPFTSGVAALLASSMAQPNADAIRIALTSSADALAGHWVNSASGRIDAAAALAALPRTAPPVVATSDQAPPATSFRILPPGLIHGLVMFGARAADDGGVARVELDAGGRLIGTDSTSPYAFGWQSAGYTGAVTLTLRAYDRAGNLATASSVVTADNSPPSVTITNAPANGTRKIAATAYVTVVAGDTYGLRMIELLVNGKVTQVFNGGTFRFAVPARTYGATIKIQVRGYDVAGNSRTTPARTWYR